MIRYSVIIPAYNAESTIAQCVASLMAQTLADWECIIVDDGSSDATPELCEQLAANDRRIHVHHTSNHGVAAARNRGMQLAMGEWLIFVDADDSLSPDYLSLLRQGADADLVITGHQEVFEDRVASQPLVSADVLLGKDAIAGFLSANLHRLPLVTVWAKAFRREYVVRNGLRFDEGLRLGEDCAFIFAYFRQIESCMVLSATPYRYKVSTNPFGYAMSCQEALRHLAVLDDSYRELSQRWNFQSSRYVTFHAHSFLRSYSRFLRKGNLWRIEPYRNISAVMSNPFVVKGLFDATYSGIFSARMCLASLFKLSRATHCLRPYLYFLSRCYTK